MTNWAKAQGEKMSDKPTKGQKIEKPDANRELEFLINILYDLTKEYVENYGDMVKVVFRHAYRSAEFLTCIKPDASVAAYNDFYKVTGKDIREFNWHSRVKKKNGEAMIIHKEYQWEHKTTANAFKENLIKAYKEHRLTKSFIAKLIKEQKICWITKAENKVLDKNGHRINRPDPDMAYDKAGIKIKQSILGNRG